MDTDYDIKLLIKRHEKFLGLATTSTKKILNYAVELDLDKLLTESDNRERLLNNIGNIQKIIEKIIMHEEYEDNDQSHLKELKLWSRNYQATIDTINELDDQIVQLLEQAKESTHTEIKSIFNSLKKIKGYNLQDVSR